MQNKHIIHAQLFICILLCGCKERIEVRSPQIHGEFELVLMTQPHTLRNAKIVIVNNFSCPHCAKFNEVESEIEDKYRGKVQVEYVDVIVNDKTRDAAIAHHLAKKLGKGREVRRFLFSSLSKSGSWRIDTDVLKSKFGIDVNSISQEEFEELRKRSDIAYRVATTTPTIIINEQIATAGDMKEISRILDQLLVKPDSAGMAQKDGKTHE